ncbi:hypothetical protein GGF31_005200 [Allomyces arbusculus]|nr:hypothetical protein GGF31_005200 [Allomyces arbusculus]
MPGILNDFERINNSITMTWLSSPVRASVTAALVALVATAMFAQVVQPVPHRYFGKFLLFGTRAGLEIADLAHTFGTAASPLVVAEFVSVTLPRSAAVSTVRPPAKKLVQNDAVAVASTTEASVLAEPKTAEPVSSSMAAPMRQAYMLRPLLGRRSLCGAVAATKLRASMRCGPTTTRVIVT